jgi:hypothetical protein
MWDGGWGGVYVSTIASSGAHLLSTPRPSRPLLPVYGALKVWYILFLEHNFELRPLRRLPVIEHGAKVTAPALIHTPARTRPGPSRVVCFIGLARTRSAGAATLLKAGVNI